MSLGKEQVSDLLEGIRDWHSQGKTAAALAFLHGVLQLELESEDLHGAVDELARELRYSEAQITAPGFAEQVLAEFRELFANITEVIPDSLLSEQAGFSSGFAAGKALSDAFPSEILNGFLPQFSEIVNMLGAAQELGASSTSPQSSPAPELPEDLSVAWELALRQVDDGEHWKARTSWQQLQQKFDELAESDAVLAARARTSMHGAANLDELGQHAEALVMHWDAQGRLASLADCEEVLHDRVIARMNRATCFQRLGGSELAAEVYADALAMLQAMPVTDRSRCSEAKVRTNAAGNLIALGQYEQVEEECDRALLLLNEIQDGPSTRLNRSAIHETRARNLQLGGYFAKADLAIRLALEELGASDRSPAALRRRAVILKSWASISAFLGRGSQADAMYREASHLLTGLEDSPWRTGERCNLLMNWGKTLTALARVDEAESVCLQAQEMADKMQFTHDTFRTRARARMHRAANLIAMKRFAQADALLFEALKLYEQMPDSEIVRFEVSQARLHQIESLRLTGRASEAVSLLNVEFELLESLQVHAGSDVSNQIAELARHSCVLARCGVLLPARCVDILQGLVDWSLTWLDTMVSPHIDESISAPPGASAAAQAVHLALSWFLESHHTDFFLNVLSQYHSRYAAAQRLLALEPSRDSETERALIHRLKLELRSLAGQLQAHEECHPAAQDEGFLKRLEQIRARRRVVRDELLQRLRTFRGERDTQRSSLLVKDVQSVLAARGALLVLTSVSDLKSGGEHGHALLIRRDSVDRIPLPRLQRRVAPPSLANGAHRGSRGSQERRGESGMQTPAEQRASVVDAWSTIAPYLSEVSQVFVAVHQAMGELPWSAAEDASQKPRDLSVYQGLNLALLSLERGHSARVRPPGVDRSLGLLTHSPGSELWGPIPGVYIDRLVTTTLVAHSTLVNGREELLAASHPLLQLSCHGQPKKAITGPGEMHTTAHELAEALYTQGRRLEACILVACSTGLAADNDWGESGGWGAVLGAQTDLVVGALQPVDDLLSSLLVLLLHRDWQACGDLKASLRSVRNRLRSGEWADDEESICQVQRKWLSAVDSCADAYSQPSSIEMNSAQRARMYVANRKSLYESEPRLQALAELFVAFG